MTPPRPARPALALALAATGGCLFSNRADGGDDVAAAFSPTGRQVIATLAERHGAARGITWDLSADNALDPDWILATPRPRYFGQPVTALPVAASCAGDPTCDPDFDLMRCASDVDCTHGGTCAPVLATVARPGDPVRRLCVGHSDAFYDELYAAIVEARHTVEISSLGPPDGRFLAALRNAITYLSYVGAPIRVRYLWGAILGAELEEFFPTPAAIAAELARDAAPDVVRIGVGAVRADFDSWDHAKVIAVDGELAIVGGHNLMTRHYLQRAPAFDLSMALRGGAAADAARFVGALWRATCAGPPSFTSSVDVAGRPDPGAACDPMPAPAVIAAGELPVITVGRLGALGDDAADDAIPALIDAATAQVRMSQQDLGPIWSTLPWPEPILRSITAALGRGVHVYLVMTNPEARPDGLTSGSASYSNGWTAADVVRELARYATDHRDLVPGAADVPALVCAQLHVASLRLGPADDAWPDGTSFANHAKLVIADDQAFYLGSQNLYPSNLAELGYIVDDAAATRALVDAYFAPAWQASRRVAVSGADAELPCALAP